MIAWAADKMTSMTMDVHHTRTGVTVKTVNFMGERTTTAVFGGGVPTTSSTSSRAPPMDVRSCTAEPDGSGFWFGAVAEGKGTVRHDYSMNGAALILRIRFTHLDGRLGADVRRVFVRAK
jgi:hypothetical protein